MNVTVVIPAKNEEATIGELITACKPYSREIIVSDGHSTDRTREIARSLGARVILDHGRGKGDAIRSAIAHIQEPIAVFMDADMSHDPKDIPRLAEPILKGEADHVVGSRLLGGSSELHGSFNECFRLMGSSLVTACINWRFGVRISDSQNGFRAIRTEVLRRLNLAEDIATIEQEMIMKTLKLGFRMAEVPAHEYCRQYGRSHILLRKVWFRWVYTLIKYLI